MSRLSRLSSPRRWTISHDGLHLIASDGSSSVSFYFSSPMHALGQMLLLLDAWEHGDSYLLNGHYRLSQDDMVWLAFRILDRLMACPNSEVSTTAQVFLPRLLGLVEDQPFTKWEFFPTDKNERPAGDDLVVVDVLDGQLLLVTYEWVDELYLQMARIGSDRQGIIESRIGLLSQDKDPQLELIGSWEFAQVARRIFELQRGVLDDWYQHYVIGLWQAIAGETDGFSVMVAYVDDSIIELRVGPMFKMRMTIGQALTWIGQYWSDLTSNALTLLVDYEGHSVMISHLQLWIAMYSMADIMMEVDELNVPMTGELILDEIDWPALGCHIKEFLESFPGDDVW